MLIKVKRAEIVVKTGVNSTPDSFYLILDALTDCLTPKHGIRDHKQVQTPQNDKVMNWKCDFLGETAAILDFGPAHFFFRPQAKNFVISSWNRVNEIQKTVAKIKWQKKMIFHPCIAHSYL